MISLPRLMLGANPFHGVSYKSSELRKQYRQHFTDSQKVFDIIDACFQLGVKGVHSYCKEIELDAVKQAKQKYGDDFVVVSVLPDIYGAAQRQLGSSALSGNLALIKTLMGNAANLFKAGVMGDMVPMFSKIMDAELDFIRDTNPSYILLHGGLTDMALGAEKIELLHMWSEKVEKFGAVPGLATHNLGLCWDKLEKFNLKYPVIMAPANPRGFMMNPGKERCEEIIRNRGDVHIIAKKILAGGPVPPAEGFRYVFEELEMDSAAVGIATRGEAYETVEAARDVLEGLGKTLVDTGPPETMQPAHT